jgi:alpha-glucosidase (family GH31 glycosyl hydrolase)
MDNRISIKHLPEGLNDPYQHFKYERYPRNPVEGDLVIVKAQVEPDWQEHEVYLRWKFNGQEQEPVQARKVLDFVESKTHYEFNLGRFGAGDKVTYTIEVIDKEQTYSTEEYSFTVGGEYVFTQVKEVSYYNNGVVVEFTNQDDMDPVIYFSFERGNLRIYSSLKKIEVKSEDKTSFTTPDEGRYIYKNESTGYYVELTARPFSFVIKDKSGNELISSVKKTGNFWGCIRNDYLNFNFKFETDSPNFYGFGEKFDSLNQKKHRPDICVYNQHSNQQNRTYMPVPFFMTTSGYGMFIKSSRYLGFKMGEKIDNLVEINGRVSREEPYLAMVIFLGKPAEILKAYLEETGFPALPPRWVFGPWMSANSWNTQQNVVEQIGYMNNLKIPATVLVIEAWSDEQTFYIFNGARYEARDGGETFSYEDFSFTEDGQWPDPRKMVELVHDNNLKLILWQIPIIRYSGKEGYIEQHALDEKHVIEKGYCVKNEDGTPYRITDGWFGNSLLIDFNNPEAVEWWFKKREYLINELEIDGFKTDGGEFVFDNSLVFADGKRGDEMRNLYPISYIKSYHEFIGKYRVTFSRAGFTGAQNYPLYWAGDQKSTFSTLKSALIAGLSCNISGNPFWGWDIAGFSGEIPTAELYIRSTQFATFCPVMQFHSEDYNDTPNKSNIWNRTPWNIAERTGDERVIDIYRFYANLRMNLIPYIYNEAKHVVRYGEPLMRPLAYEYPEDNLVYNIEDEYLFGRSLLVAPVVEEGQRQREIYLPEGKWVDFWTGKVYNGNCYLKYLCDLDRIPVFIKSNSILALNLNADFEIGGYIGNDLSSYYRLSYLITGDLKDCYQFRDDLGNKVKIDQGNTVSNLKITGSGELEKVYIITNTPLKKGKKIGSVAGRDELLVYEYTLS